MSSRLVRHLLANGHTAQGLAEALGLGKSFISLVKSGERSLRLEHLQQIERLTGTPLPLLLLQVHDKGAVPEPLRKSYRLLNEFLGRSRQLREAIKGGK